MGLKLGRRLWKCPVGMNRKTFGELKLCSGLGHWKSSQAHMYIFRQSKLDNDSIASLAKTSHQNATRKLQQGSWCGPLQFAVIRYPQKAKFKEKRLSLGLQFHRGYSPWRKHGGKSRKLAVHIPAHQQVQGD